MNVTHDTMQELASKLDCNRATLESADVTVELVCSMAYQIQYFFEAMEEIKKMMGAPDYYKVCDAYDVLKNQLVHKEN